MYFKGDIVNLIKEMLLIANHNNIMNIKVTPN